MAVVTEPAKSTHKVEVVDVTLLPHGNADALSIIPVFGYTYVGRTEDWVGVRRGAYIPPDSIVDATRPEFAFLAPMAKGPGLKVRIKAKKLRGVVSFGFMVPVPDDTPLGGDWAKRLGVEHYEPPMAGTPRTNGYLLGGEEEAAPTIYAPKYDLDAFRRYHSLFEPGEPVVVTEKLDGANARFAFHGGKMYCGSRERWTKEFPDYSHVSMEFLTGQGMDETRAAEIIAGLQAKPKKRNIWWQALQDYPGIEEWCRKHPSDVLYGEVFGEVNSIKYGLGGNRFAAFDVCAGGRWLDAEGTMFQLSGYCVPFVPLIAAMIPYDFDAVCAMAEGPTTVEGAKAGTIREGVVVSPVVERTDPHLGRVKLKVVSADYLERYR